MTKVFEVKKKVGKVKLPNGVTVEIRIPAVSEAFEVQNAVKEADPGDAINVLEKFYMDLGLSKEHLTFFDGDDYTEFFTFLLGSKKN